MTTTNIVKTRHEQPCISFPPISRMAVGSFRMTYPVKHNIVLSWGIYLMEADVFFLYYIFLPV